MGLGEGKMGWTKALKNHYETIFVEEWPAAISGVILGFLIVVAFAWNRPWGVQGGLRNWGDWLNHFIGLSGPLGSPSPPVSPISHSTSLMVLGLLLGSFAAALMAKQFAIRIPPVLEMVKGVIGGSLMGMGATLSYGCNVGGLITPITGFYLSGWSMWVGMTLGAAIGIKILWWEMEHIMWGRKSLQSFKGSSGGGYKPYLGLLVVAGVLWWASNYLTNKELKTLGGVLLIGFAFGVVLHRSRFCFSRVFRDPLMTGDASMTKAAILMLAIAVIGNAFLLNTGSTVYLEARTPVFWIGGLLGGTIFGIGMIAAGGCASGSIWRLGEGQIKLLIALFFFAWTSSWWRAILVKWGVLVEQMNFKNPMFPFTKLGTSYYMPKELDSWFWALAISLGLLLIWFILAVYNEATERFTVIDS